MRNEIFYTKNKQLKEQEESLKNRIRESYYIMRKYDGASGKTMVKLMPESS